MIKTITIFWFRRDLRLEDNAGFNAAMESGHPVLPIFIFDENLLADLPVDDARVSFIHQLLTDLNRLLVAEGSSLATFFGNPVTIFKTLAEIYKINSVFANNDYEPYARKRDSEIAAELAKSGARFHKVKDHVVFEEDEIVKGDGSPYVVFTPYAKKWKARLSVQNYQATMKGKRRFVEHGHPFLKLSAIGFKPSAIIPKPLNISPDAMHRYANLRDFPAAEATTGLSPYLRFGAVSIPSVVASALSHNNHKLLDELIWREFFIQILWHFPNTVTRSFKPKYDNIRWRNNETEFERWCTGNTGYPIIDAGMRELNATGIIHNRVRMIVAGFLCKHLLIDWRWGEAYFALKLLDYEQASNVGNWQWAAGSGVDAAPYFRIFNPSEQVKKFDKDLQYIKKWVPEVDKFSYPEPIVDHKEARERCLKVYREALV